MSPSTQMNGGAKFRALLRQFPNILYYAQKRCARGDTAPLSKRLSSWAIQHNILSQEQKRARPTEGCYKHTFLLKSILCDACVNKSCLFIAWLDLRNTFGSIPLPATSSTLASLKLSSRLSATYTLEQPNHPYFRQLN